MPLIESEALVVRTVEVGESDVVATLVTERAGKVSLVVRGARKGSRRVGGALEPMHTIGVLFEDKGAELCTLKESRIVRLRSGLVGNLDALEAAGVALRWARHLFPPRTLEPEGWHVLIDLLDRLDGVDSVAAPHAAGGAPLATDRVAPKSELARAGLAMLAAVGYALEFGQCVVCGRVCPEGRPAFVDPARGGLVCRACGGAHSLLAADVRAAAQAMACGATAALDDRRAQGVLSLVERAMAAHTGFER